MKYFGKTALRFLAGAVLLFGACSREPVESGVSRALAAEAVALRKSLPPNAYTSALRVLVKLFTV